MNRNKTGFVRKQCQECKKLIDILVDEYICLWGFGYAPTFKPRQYYIHWNCYHNTIKKIIWK